MTRNCGELASDEANDTFLLVKQSCTHGQISLHVSVQECDEGV